MQFIHTHLSTYTQASIHSSTQQPQQKEHHLKSPFYVEKKEKPERKKSGLSDIGTLAEYTLQSFSTSTNNNNNNSDSISWEMLIFFFREHKTNKLRYVINLSSTYINYYRIAWIEAVCKKKNSIVCCILFGYAKLCDD